MLALFFWLKSLCTKRIIFEEPFNEEKKRTEILCCRQTEHFCLSRDFARQASAQAMCVSSEWSSLVSFDPVFVEIFRFCNLTDLALNYRP